MVDAYSFGYDDGYRKGLEDAAEIAMSTGKAISKGVLRSAGPNNQGEITSEQIMKRQAGTMPSNSATIP